MAATTETRNPISTREAVPAHHHGRQEYNVSLGYLRAAVTVLVVAHHAVLAYVSFAPPPPASLVTQPRWWAAFPVVDKAHWDGFGLLVGFNDTFFMSLMFFLSGLFVWNSLERKGTRKFLRDRTVRLGIPFLAAAAIVAPVAYFPSYLMTGAEPAISGFLREWLALGQWPAGPAWFIALLLAFDLVAAGLFALVPQGIERAGHILSAISQKPLTFFGIVIGISAGAYMPMVHAFNPLHWTAFGPFAFQTSRLFHYLAYFLIAVALGAWSRDRGLLSPEGGLVRYWGRWSFIALIVFALTTVGAIAVTTHPNPPTTLLVAANLGFVFTCAAISFACLAVFLRFFRTRSLVLDGLRDNAYGIYLLHYAFVTWLQYALLGSVLSGLTKGMVVFIGALALSWAAVSALRRTPGVRRVL